MVTSSKDAQIIANIVIGSNGATTIKGSSRGLSSNEDRKRFHKLRQVATAIVIGGQTFRNEPYSHTPLPLFVASHHVTEEMRAKNSLAHFSPSKPSTLVDEVLSLHGAPILIEGGVNLVAELISNSKLDQICITRTQIVGDKDWIFDETLLRTFTMVSSEMSDQEVFEVWQRVQN